MSLSCFFRSALFSSLLGLSVLAIGADARAVNLDPTNWTETTFASSNLLQNGTGLAWAPDGTNRLFVTRKTGQVAIIKDGTLLTTGTSLDAWATVSPIFLNSECGLIGIAFHPNFVDNHYVYLFVTVSNTEQQIQRWIDNPATNKGTFDKVIVGGLATNGVNHDGGGIGFGRDGKLYWSIGDNGSPVTGVDNNLTSFAAKVSRATDEGAVPLDNPFYDGAGPNNDYIWARGFRNPFTMTFRPENGEHWLNVVGTLWEQIFVVTKGGHGGWDDRENDQNQFSGYLTPVLAYRTNNIAPAAVNQAARVSNVTTITTATNHQFHRGAQVQLVGLADASFNGTFFITSTPSLTTFTIDNPGTNQTIGIQGQARLPQFGGAIGGGTFYASTRFPEEYWGNFFFGDYNSGNYFRVTLDGIGPTSVRQFADYSAALDTAVGPDGALYMLEYAFGSTPGAVYRTVPVAVPTGPIVTPTDVWLVEGGRAVFEVSLPSQPTVPVILAIVRTAGDTDVTVDEGATLTFNAGNWDKPQRVVLAAAADVDRLDDQATFTVTGTDLTTRTVHAYVADQPRAIYAYPSPLTINEGSSATLSVGLAEAVTETTTVNVAITGDSDVTAAATLTFEPSDGTTPKLLTVSAALDGDTLNDSATITLTATGHVSKTVAVTVVDGTSTAPVFTTTPTTTGIVNRPYTYDANVSGSPTATFALTVAPAGASIDPATGVVNYTPSATGSVSFTITASNGVGDTTQSFTLMVSADAAPTAALTRPTIDEIVIGSGNELFGDCIDDVGCTKGEFYIDDVLVYTDVNGGNHFHIGGGHAMWDVTSLANGAHTVKLVVYDTAGQTGQDTASFLVDNSSLDLSFLPDLVVVTEDLATVADDLAAPEADLAEASVDGGVDLAGADQTGAALDLAGGVVTIAGGGCGCRATGSGDVGGVALLVACVWLAMRRRRVRSAGMLVVVLVGVSVARVALADDCRKQVNAARSEANKSLAKGDAKTAVASLVRAKQRCPSLDAAGTLWLLSDLSFAAHKAGDDKACAAAIAEADDDALAANPKIAKAMLHNAELCAPRDGCDYKLDGDEPVCKAKLAIERSARAPYADFAAAPCTIAGYEKQAISLGGGAMCVGVTETKRKPGTRDKNGDVEEGSLECPRFFAVETRGGKTNKRWLTIEDGWWTSESDCCGAKKLLSKEQGIVLTSGGIARDCFGGTAATDFFTVLKLVGSKLVVEQDLSIGWH